MFVRKQFSIMVSKLALVLQLAAGLFHIQILISPSTPPEVTEAIQSWAPGESLSITSAVSVVTRLNFTLDPRSVALLDYSYDTSLSTMLLYEDCALICMYEGCPQQHLQSRMLPEEYGQALARVLTELGFTNAFLAFDSRPWNQRIAAELKASAQLSFTEELTLNEHLSDAQIELFVGRVLKPAGTNLAVFLVNSSTAVRITRLLSSYHLFTRGFAYVYSEQAVWELFNGTAADGLLYVSDNRTSLARSRVEFERYLLQSQVEAIAEGVQGADSAPRLREFLKSSHHGKARDCSPVLVNIQRGLPVVSHTLLLPGNSTTVPKHTRGHIEISANYDAHSADGSVYPDAEYIATGFIIGYEEVNKREDILPNFDIINNTVSTGVLFDLEWAVQRLAAQRESLGVAHHAVPLSQNVMGVTAAMQIVNATVPVTTAASSSKLSDPKSYPFFVRTTSSALYSATVMARFFKLFGWKRTAFIYSPVEEDLDYYRCFLAVSEQYGVEITNSEASRMLLPSLLDEQVNATLAEVMSSSVRIITLSHLFGYLIIERMYDLGARAGDYLFLVPYGLSKTFYMGKDESGRKRREVARGAMTFFAEMFVGEVGKSFYSRVYARDQEKMYPLSCVFYDCSMLVAHALDFMVSRGLHYESPAALVKEMRQTRFTGCIGHVQIEAGTNDKMAGDYSIINMQVDDNFENLSLEVVARYSPFKTQLFNVSENIQWPNKARSFPDSWETDPDCPYYIKDIRDFPNGRLLSMVVCFVSSALTAVATVFIWRRWWNVKYEKLTEPQVISMEDVFALASVPVDFVQLAAVGPSVGLGSVVVNLLNSTSLNLDSFVNMTHGIFWAVEIATFLLVFLYMLVSAVKLFSLDAIVERVCKSISFWTDMLLPALGNALFLPAVTTLISTFNCFRSTGPSFADSFLNRDCYQRCWQGTHITFAAVASVLLILYTPIAVFTRPLWQSLQTNLHLKAFPLLLMVKSVVQMFLSSAATTLRNSEEGSHGFIYLATITCYLSVNLSFGTYNYDR